MLQSIDYSHRKNIIHRDIKLENFLVDTIENETKIIIKLSDFGMACILEKESPPTEKCGSIRSAAPEMFFEKSFCSKIDMWGLGVILYELFSNEIPFYDDKDVVYIDNIMS